jgi:hypothetical protein
MDREEKINLIHIIQVIDLIEVVTKTDLTERLVFFQFITHLAVSMSGKILMESTTSLFVLYVTNAVI